MCFAPQQKAAGAEPSGQMRNKKLHAAGARNTFPSQNAQNTSTQDNSWKSTCRKSTPVWCEAHFEVKMLKHLSFGTLLGIELSKKCTPLRREAHVQFNMYKTHQRRSTFGGWAVEEVHGVVAPSTFRSQNVQNTPGSEHFWRKFAF